MKIDLVLPAVLAAAMLGCGRKDIEADPPKLSGPAVAQAERYETAAKALLPLHQKKRPPGPSDWLANHEERGQTFQEYVRSDPVRPDDRRHTLYITLLGEFNEEQREIVEKTAAFMRIYFNCPVDFTDPLPVSAIPEARTRKHYGNFQLDASYILDRVLKPRVPEDALALIAFSAADLYPDPDWNFVFGLASLYGRVGVWSIFRFGDPRQGGPAYRRCLLRTIKVGTHETGHMIGMRHCTAYECNMNGSNHMAESDGCPMQLCPECVRKIWWACHGDPVERFEGLRDFCKRHDLPDEAENYQAALEKIRPIFAK